MMKDLFTCKGLNAEVNVNYSYIIHDSYHHGRCRENEISSRTICDRYGCAGERVCAQHATEEGRKISIGRNTPMSRTYISHLLDGEPALPARLEKSMK